MIRTTFLFNYIRKVFFCIYTIYLLQEQAQKLKYQQRALLYSIVALSYKKYFTNFELPLSYTMYTKHTFFTFYNHHTSLFFTFQKVENVSIVVPLQPLCGEEMEMDITFVMPVDCITK